MSQRDGYENELYRELDELANELQEEADEGKKRYFNDTWQYGQAMGFEKAAHRITEVLKDVE